MQLREDSSILALIAQGAGFSILPWLAVEPLSAGVALRPLPVEQHRPLRAVLLPGVARQPPVRALRQVLSSGTAFDLLVRRGLLGVVERG